MPGVNASGIACDSSRGGSDARVLTRLHGGIGGAQRAVQRCPVFSDHTCCAAIPALFALALLQSYCVPKLQPKNNDWLLRPQLVALRLWLSLLACSCTSACGLMPVAFACIAPCMRRHGLELGAMPALLALSHARALHGMRAASRCLQPELSVKSRA